jgi:hypothetical protein
MLTVGLCACGSSADHTVGATADRRSPLLDTQRVASAIEQSVLHQRELHARVFCPSLVPQAQGQTFTCLAYAPGVSPAAFTVIQLDGAGHVRYSSM